LPVAKAPAPSAVLEVAPAEQAQLTKTRNIAIAE